MSDTEMLAWGTAGFFLILLFFNTWTYRRRTASRKRRYQSHVASYNTDKARLEEEIKGLKTRLAKKAKRLQPKEWHLIGVLLQNMKVGDDRRVYAIVEFNPETGMLRPAPPEYRFFTINGHDEAFWNRCGGNSVPRTLLTAPSWSFINEEKGAIPDILMLGQVYHFRYGGTNPYVQIAEDKGPKLHIVHIEAEEEGAPRRLTA